MSEKPIDDLMRNDPQFKQDMEEMRADLKHFECAVDHAKQHFGEWDSLDPTVWALLRVVEAQNDLAAAIYESSYADFDSRVLERAIGERIEAIAALKKAVENEPRAFQ
jgi:hypothetical protein